MSNDNPSWGQPSPEQPQGVQPWSPPPGWSPQQPPPWPGAATAPASQPAWPAVRPGYPPVAPQQVQHAWAAPALAPKPGIVALRPLGIGELLDGALGLIRSNPKTVLGMAAVISAISALLQTIGMWASYAVVGNASLSIDGAPADVEAELTGTLVSAAVQIVPAIVSGLLQVAASGLFIVLVGAAVLGRKLDASDTWALLRPRMLGLIGLSLLMLVVGIAAGVVIVGLLVALGALLGNWGFALGALLAILCLLGLIYIYIRLAVASPALVMEGRPVLKSLGRSWKLVRGSFWRVLGILLLSMIIVNVLTGIIAVPFVGASMIATVSTEAAWPLIVATGLATLLSGIITLPFSAAVTGLLYTDLRIRREALDIELVTAGVDPTGDPLAPYRRFPN